MGIGDNKTSLHPGKKLEKVIRNKSGFGENGNSEDESQLRENIRDYGWDELESKYIQMMEQHGKAEEDLREHITKLLQISTAWSQTTVAHDEVRALKRFRTQMHHVQNSEESLEKKRNHYVDVVKAFESALALLNDRVRN